MFDRSAHSNTNIPIAGDRLTKKIKASLANENWKEHQRAKNALACTNCGSTDDSLVAVLAGHNLFIHGVDRLCAKCRKDYASMGILKEIEEVQRAKKGMGE